MIANDFLVDDNGDELIQDGDYVVGPSDVQHFDDLIISFPASWREYPTCGVGVRTMQSGPEQRQRLEAIIRQQMAQDGYSNVQVQTTYQNNELSISVNGERL